MDISGSGTGESLEMLWKKPVLSSWNWKRNLVVLGYIWKWNWKKCFNYYGRYCTCASKGLHTPGNFVACNSCNQVVTRVQQLCYRADTTLLQLLQATKLPGVSRLFFGIQSTSLNPAPLNLAVRMRTMRHCM